MNKLLWNALKEKPNFIENKTIAKYNLRYLEKTCEYFESGCETGCVTKWQFGPLEEYFLRNIRHTNVQLTSHLCTIKHGCLYRVGVFKAIGGPAHETETAAYVSEIVFE